MTPATSELVRLSVPVAAGLLMLLVALYIWLRRRRSRALERLLEKNCLAMLRNAVIGDGEGGQIFIEYALLCSHGIVILTLRNVQGTLFAANSMREWAIISNGRRSGMPNPQPGLYDCMAAVRRIVTEVPVSGFIVLTGQPVLSKERPQYLLLEEELLQVLQPDSSKPTDEKSALGEWDKLVQAALPTAA